jgi:hypothetical protein
MSALVTLSLQGEGTGSDFQAMTLILAAVPLFGAAFKRLD